MINFPVIRRLWIEGYQVFDNEYSSGIEHVFDGGVHLIIGVNGLGKTTLLNILYRLLTGPKDLRKSDKTSLAATQHSLSKWRSTDYFRSRVANDAKGSVAAVEAQFGGRKIYIKRALRNLEIVKLVVDGQERDAGEDEYTKAVEELSGLSSFFDFFALLRYLVFFLEDRAELIWDTRSQFEMLRILFYDKESSIAASTEYDTAQKKDSAYRNLHAAIKERRDRLKLLEPRNDGEAEIIAQFELAEKALEGLRAKDDDLAQRHEDLRSSIDARRLRREKLALELEEARFNYEYEQQGLFRGLFPDITDAAEYVFRQLASGGGCIVCGNHSPNVGAKLVEAVHQGKCPVCESPKERHENIVPYTDVSIKRVERLREKIEELENDINAQDESIIDEDKELRELLVAREQLIEPINHHRRQVNLLRRRLPREGELQETRNFIDLKEKELFRFERERTEAENNYLRIKEQNEKTLDDKINRVIKSFNRIAESLLAERCELAKSSVTRRIGEGGINMEFPCFVVQMTSGVFSRFPQSRENAASVSESQREFIDLAFRMALIEVATENTTPAMLVLETPEASLDSVFVAQASALFREFSAGCGGTNLFLASTNLNQGELIPQMLGLHSPPTSNEELIIPPVEERKMRVINLLERAAPNATYKAHKEHYDALFRKAVFPDLEEQT